jgi:HK97 gp10 family phage protein
MLNWNGDAIVDKAKEAAKAAVDETNAAAGEQMRSSHPWQSDTGELEREIEDQPAQVEGSSVRGGVNLAPHWILLELGTVNAPAYPFVRPAIDAEYPQLAGRTREHFEDS